MEKKILLCDDSITVRKKLIQSLKTIIECDIIEATNGEEAVNLYTSHKPDLVFMDIVMPFMDGLEALKHIIGHDSNAKVIMLSSAGTKANLQQALKSGAVDFVQKPWVDERLKVVIQSHLKEVE